MKRLVILLLALLFPVTLRAQAEPLKVVATSNILADVAQQVGGDYAIVTALIPAGADGHAWQPRPADIVQVAQADLLLAVGVEYESFLGQMLDNAADVPQVIVSIGVPILPFASHEDEVTAETGHADDDYVGIYGEPGVCEDDHVSEATAEAQHDHGICDSHVWTDPTNVMIWAQNIAAALAAADPDHAAEYQANAAAYIEQLTALDADVQAILATVPEARRVLVTNHEFLGYFAHRYGFTLVESILGATSLDEPDPQRLAALVNTVREQGVPAIFAEVSAQSRLADVVAQEAGVTVETSLYSESLSAADGPAATYLDYLRYNAQQIAAALGE